MVDDKIGKPFKSVVLLPVHIRFYFSEETGWYFVFIKALCNAESTAIFMINWIILAFMIRASTKRYFHLKNLQNLVKFNDQQKNFHLLFLELITLLS